MSAQGNARLFVALWPGAATRDALVAAGDAWRWNAGAARVAPERLHLTLHFIGSVERERVPALREALARVPQWAPFTLTLARARIWSGGIAVVESQRVPPHLLDLHAAIGIVLAGLALPVETRALRPHVTLARKAAGATPPDQPIALRWAVRGFALVESHPASGYVPIQRYRCVSC